MTSFYVPVRSNNARTNDQSTGYLKVDIHLDGGTFYVVFSERLDLPFPVRVENLTQVSVSAHQHDTLEENEPLTVKAGESANYAWSEPSAVDKRIVISVKGGTQLVFELAETAGPTVTRYLYYENYFYIVFDDGGKDVATAEPTAELGLY